METHDPTGARKRSGSRLRRLGPAAFVVAALAALLASWGMVEPGRGGASPAEGRGNSPKPLPTLPAEVRSRGRWQVGVKCNTPPFGYRNSQGQHKGYDPDVARELAFFAFGRRSAVDFVCTTTDDRIPTLTAKRVDILISTMTWTAERERVVDFSVPYYGASGRLLVKTSVSVSTLAAWLPGKRVVTTRDSIYQRWLTKCFDETQVQLVRDPSFGVLAVQNGQADAMMYDDAFLVGAVINDRTLKMSKHVFLKVPWGIGIRKGDTSTKRWIDAAVLRMKARDTFWRILTRTIPRRFHPQFKTYVPRPKVTLRYPREAPAESKCP